MRCFQLAPRGWREEMARKMQAEPPSIGNRVETRRDRARHAFRPRPRRPPHTVRIPRRVAESRLRGATPTSAASRLRSRCSSSAAPPEQRGRERGSDPGDAHEEGRPLLAHHPLLHDPLQLAFTTRANSFLSQRRCASILFLTAFSGPPCVPCWLLGREHAPAVDISPPCSKAHGNDSRDPAGRRESGLPQNR